MSRVVFSSTFGAVFGPLLIGPTQHRRPGVFDLQKYTGPFLLSGVFLFLAFVNTILRLRPDPLHVAAQVRGTTMAASKPDLRIVSTLKSAWATPMARLAILTMIVSQATMVAVMAMTPVHLKLHGHEGVSPYVVSLHIAGMYAFSPWVGKFADKNGRLANHRHGGDPPRVRHPVVGVVRKMSNSCSFHHCGSSDWAGTSG